MFGSIGGAELVLILVLALLLFGPRKLPQIGRTLGKSLSEFRRATTEFKMNLEREVRLDEVKEVGREITETVDDVKKLAVARDDETTERSSVRKPEAEPPSPSGTSASSPDAKRSRPS